MRNRDPRPSAVPTSTRRARRAGSRPVPGQALIEAAIGIVLLLLLSFSVLDAAMLFYAYLTLQNGVTEATRFAVTGQQANNPSNPTRNEEEIMRIVRNSTPGLQPILDSEFSFCDVTNPNNIICNSTGGPDSVIQVTVRHPYKLITPMVWPLVGAGGVINLRVSATMKNEHYPTVPNS